MTEYAEALAEGKPGTLQRRIHVGDAGLAFVVRVMNLAPNDFDPEGQASPDPYDLSDAFADGTVQIVFKKPISDDGTVNPPVVVEADVCTVDPPLPGQQDNPSDGTDGYAQITSDEDTFDVPGLWEAQVVVTNDPLAFRSQVFSFRVHPVLQTE